MGANAQTSVPAFTAGQVLTAAQMTQVNTGIPVFASSTERDAAFGGTGEKTLAEGQYAFLEDTNETQVYDGRTWAAVGQAGGKILQVVSTAKLDTFSTSSTTYVDVTGLSVSITPTASTSKVFVTTNFVAAQDSTQLVFFVIDRNGTDIFVSTDSLSGMIYPQHTTEVRYVSMSFLDSPATTSALTYKIQMKVDVNTGYVGRRAGPTVLDIPGSITVMEVSA